TDDVAFTFERIADPKRPSDARGKMRIIKSVTPVDDKHIRFELNTPSQAFLRYMASPELTGIVSRKFTMDHNNDLSTIANGTGPFKVTKFQGDLIIKYERNPDYWQPELPYLDGFEIRIIADDATRIAALRTGEIDMTFFRPDKMPLIRTL